MQMISTVVRRQQAFRMSRVAGSLVKVDDGIEVARCANPLIYGKAVRLAIRSGMIIVGAGIRKNGRADHFDSVGVRSHHKLLVRGKNATDKSAMFGQGNFAGAGKAAQVIHAFENDQIANAGLREDVTIETRQRVRPQAVYQKMVSADSLVQDAQGSCAG